MDGTRIGELAALGTATCWTVTAIAFEVAGRRVGSLAVNLVRLALAAVLLAGYGALVRGLPFPTDATPHAWMWLSLSGFVGFTLGDLCLFRAFVLLGARLSLLVMAVVPLLTALAGWAFLGEHIAPPDLAGMALTVAGVAWVVSERAPEGGPRAHLPLAGVLLAIGGAVGQAANLVISKHGMGRYDPFAATHIRVLAGGLGFAVLFTALRWWPRAREALRDRRAMAATSLGALLGPVVGVGLSLLAVQHTSTGVAATIMALPPVLILPVVRLRGERVTPRAVAGALVAVSGTALLFLAA